MQKPTYPSLGTPRLSTIPWQENELKILVVRSPHQRINLLEPRIEMYVDTLRGEVKGERNESRSACAAMVREDAEQNRRTKKYSIYINTSNYSSCRRQSLLKWLTRRIMSCI